MKRVLLTGATGGLGKEIAFALHDRERDGHIYEIIASARHSDRASGLPFKRFVSCNLREEHELYDLMEEVESIDILINCAGVFPIYPLLGTNGQDYDETFNINVKAPFELSTHYGAKMARNGWGRIINIGSSSAYHGSADCGLYCASKHALLGLTRSLHEELKPHNVQCTFVAPGSMKTPMAAKDSRVNYDELLEPADVAKQIVNLIELPDNMIVPEMSIQRMSL